METDFAIRKRRPAYTLIEVLVSLVIFAIIMSAISMAMGVALKADTQLKAQQKEAATVRAIFGALNRDIQAAFASATNPASLFTASNGQGNGSGGNSSLLTLTTLVHRIDDEGAMSTQGGAGGAGGSGSNPERNAGNADPQSGLEMVRYDLDPVQGVLTRTVAPVPNRQLLSQPVTGREGVLGQEISSLRLTFRDMANSSTRSEWNFQQSNVADSGADASSSGGRTGGSQPARSSNTDGDKMLPDAVIVELELKRKEGTSHYQTTIPILSPQPQKLAPEGTGSGGNGQNPNGNPNPGNPSGGQNPGGNPGGNNPPTGQ